MSILTEANLATQEAEKVGKEGCNLDNQVRRRKLEIFKMSNGALKRYLMQKQAIKYAYRFVWASPLLIY